MAWVWDQDMPTKEKFVLLAYADHADHEGGSIFPANATVAKKTGYSVRAIQRITRRLEESGFLIADGENVGGRHRSNRWKIPIYGGLKGDLSVMVSKERVTKQRERVTEPPLKGDTAMSPESSLTHQVQPSKEESVQFSEVVKIWEKSVGPITGGIAEELGSMADEAEAHRLKLTNGSKGSTLAGTEWVTHAIKTARKSAAGRFNVRYVQAIVDRWIHEGFDSKLGKAQTDYRAGAGEDYWNDGRN